MKHITGWWFSAGHTLPHRDGRPIALGVTHTIEGEIVPCEHGLHLSQRALDALYWAPGNIVWKVRGSGVIVPHDDDKHACSERTYLAGGIDVSDTLRHFARLCALDVADVWDAPKIVRRFLRTGDEASREAAGAAVWDASRAARATRATRATRAAWDAWDAARDARDAAWGAAWGAAWEAAEAAQNRRLTRMLNEAIRRSA